MILNKLMEEIILNPVECTSAEEFIEAISPLGDYFKRYPHNAPWLFRGLGKESYALIPKALRSDRPLSRLTKHECDNRGSQMLAERDALIDFFVLADKRGLQLPDDSQEIRKMLEILKSERGDHFIEKGFREWWPKDELLSLLALAQHYGLPTRLLDWTRNSFVAAYFAAAEASGHEQTEKIVVWSLYYPALGSLDVIGRESEPFIIVTAPTASNPNLRAQQGVFTLMMPPYSETNTIEDISLDDALVSSFTNWDKQNARLFA